MKNPLPRREMEHLRRIVEQSDVTRYCAYIEFANAADDPRIDVHSFAEWQAMGKPDPIKVLS